MYIPVGNHIELDRELRSVRKDGQEVKLTGLEYGLLAYLTQHADRICSRTELLENVWGEAFQYDTGTIDVHLNALRRKLAFSKTAPIETIRGVGLIYRSQRSATAYTIDLQSFVIRWLHSHEAQINACGLTPSLHLTPFVNEITMPPQVLQQMLDASLAALLSTASPGILRIHSKLNMTHFIFSLDINGTVSELRIPINRDFDVS
ncbi:MAG: winged helix-turn-helix transcriptional regulator [Paludibacteraceae bacterium]|nr:winged helix-turn-helix transcriptional regulator [Paludibacteraceae bacterium]